MSQKLKVHILGLFTVFLWASAFPLTKVAMAHYTPNALGFVRCTVASIFLVIIGILNHIRKPQKKDILWFFLSGGLGFTLYMITFNTGIQTLTSATSSIIIATTPIMTAVVASKCYGEKITNLGWFTIALAFVGVLILLLWDGAFSINIGLIWTIGAAIVFCGYNILNRKLSSMGYTALEIVTYSMVCGTILLAVFSLHGLAQVITAEPKHILSVIYLGVMPSAMAYFLWGKAMSLAEKTSEVTNFMFVTPLLSTALGFMLLKEIPNMGTFIGGSIIILSIILFNLKGK
ncbi:DMT family transporter [Clostridium sp. WILCCON 0269]|uniref:DMT family transporter n=1 Tax=Candidatus Clostridium eludens TaxID=3381663 RepID=A0ABW8SM10_9CLOT